MEITTRQELKDKIFYMYENMIVQGEIKSISVHISDHINIDYHLECLSKKVKGKLVTINANNAFKTKDDLINYLKDIE